MTASEVSVTRKEAPIVEVTDRGAWRSWLAVNHARVPVIWLLFWKRHTGRQGLSYEEAVQEALCYGWIDSTVKALDTARYLQKFTPRTDAGKWSPTNRRRLRRLLAEGLMTEAGLAKVAKDVLANLDSVPEEPEPLPVRLPPELESILRSKHLASEAFERLSLAEKRRYVGWITAAKRDQTRRRRLDEVIGLLATGKKLGLK